MSVILVISVGMRVAALAWSVRLLVLLRDWRLAFFSAMLALMALRQSLTLLKSPEPWPINFSANLDELPGLAVSVLAFLALIFLERTLSAERRRSRKLEGEIGERRRAEAALRKSEELFRTMTVNVPGVVYQFKIDADGQPSFPYVSPVVKDVLGIDAADIIEDPNTWFDAVHPDDRPGLDASMEKSHATLEQWQWEGRMIRCSGAVGWFRGSSTPTKLDDGSVLWNGVILDITDHAKAEASSRKNERLIRALIEHSPVAISIKGLDGRYTFVSPAYTRYLDMSANEAVGQPAREIVPPNIADRLAAADQAVLKSGNPLSEDESFTIEIGSAVLLVTKFPIHDDDGNIAGIGTVGIDVTELKEAEEHLRRSQKMEAIGHLTGGIAHDFNNMLMVIDGYTRRAANNIADPAVAESALKEVLDCAARAAKLTRQLLTFSRRQAMETRVLRVEDLVGDIRKLLDRSVDERFSLVFDIDDGRTCVETDASEFSQALLNLTVNARDAMPGGGAITFSSRCRDLEADFTAKHEGLEPGPYVEFTVADEGSGIDAKTLQHIFEPFFTTKEQGKGTGLGLAQVYGFARGSRGVVTVDSVVDKGTNFHIFLPVSDKDPAELVAEVEEEAHGNGETILLVEDDPKLLDLTGSVLSALGYNVLYASDGAEALEVEAEFEGTIDLLLSDVVMPQLGGFELAEIIRADRPDINVVFMSGYANPEQSGAKMPANSQFLQKPVQTNRLAQILRNELAA
jgi:PAS domain S-box-containing protein